jgi:hypothetical protein
MLPWCGISQFSNCTSDPQIVRLGIRSGFELPGSDAITRKEGNRLIIEAARPKSLLAILADLCPIEEKFPPIVELDNGTG